MPLLSQHTPCGHHVTTNAADSVGSGQCFRKFPHTLAHDLYPGISILKCQFNDNWGGGGGGAFSGVGGGSLCGVSLENLSSQGLLSALPHKFLLGHAGPPPLPSCLRQVKSSFLGACCFVYPLLAGALFTHVALSLTPLLGPSPPPTHGFLTSSLRH